MSWSILNIPTLSLIHKLILKTSIIYENLIMWMLSLFQCSKLPSCSMLVIELFKPWKELYSFAAFHGIQTRYSLFPLFITILYSQFILDVRLGPHILLFMILAHKISCILEQFCHIKIIIFIGCLFLVLNLTPPKIVSKKQCWLDRVRTSKAPRQSRTPDTTDMLATIVVLRKWNNWM